jgi:hypothetical protein
MYKEGLIDEANNTAAFITNDEGYDIAKLERIERPNLPSMLTDDEWQQLVNLVNAAPAMLEALRYIATLDTSQDASPEQCSAVLLAMEAIDKATK